MDLGAAAGSFQIPVCTGLLLVESVGQDAGLERIDRVWFLLLLGSVKGLVLHYAGGLLGWSKCSSPVAAPGFQD